VTTHDVFEQRAASAGAALRAAFLEGETISTAEIRDVPPAAVHTTGLDPATAVRRRPRRTLAGAAALLLAAVSVGMFALSASQDEAPDVLTAPAERERAVLSEPYLSGSGGSLPDKPVQSVQDFPVPFTFSTPQPLPAAREWRYFRTPDQFDLGNIDSGITVIAPTGTYDPARTWQGQTELVPAPTTGAGWAKWLEQTGQVEVFEPRELLIGGASATRFSLELADLPAGYDGCGGGRTCLALLPMHDPQVGPARVGSGPQVGIDEETRELTVVQLEDRAVLILTNGEPDTADARLPALRAVVESLRFA
jgi:hypothetical protein